MYPITSAAKALFEAEQRQVLRITGMDGDGNPITISDANVMADGFHIDRYACNTDKLEIGTAIAAELSLTIDNRQGQYTGVRFEGSELKVEIGIADWTQDNPEILWIPCGYFTPDEQPRALSTISLHALDRMMLFEKVLTPEPEAYHLSDESGNHLVDHNGNSLIVYPPVSNFPCTVNDLVWQCCEVCGVELAESIAGLPNAGYSVAEIPEILGDVTYRNLIQWAAGLMGTNAYIDWNGKLRFAWFDESTDYDTTTANRYSSDMYESDLTISGILFTDLQNVQHIAGDPNYMLDLTGNYLINAESADTVLQTLYIARHAFVYRPFKAEVVGAPYLWPMDRIQFVDQHGTYHLSSLTNVNFTANGHTSLTAKGETNAINHYADPGQFTKRQAAAMQAQFTTNNHLNEAVQNATEMITGARGGYIRFMYDENNNPYEMLILDEPSVERAVDVWRWNYQGLGHSSNGYEGPFNDIAITQDGSIVATYITSGTLDASRATVTNLNASNITSGTLAAEHIGAGTIAVSKLTNEAQASLVGGVTTKMRYYKSTSSSSATGGSWQDTVPAWEEGYYIWTRVATTKTYASGTSTTTYSTATYDSNLTTALRDAASAQTTASAASTVANANIKAAVTCYYRSTTNTTPTISTSTTIGTNADTDNAWEYVMPRPKNGRYFYACERYTFGNNTVGFSTVRTLDNLTYSSLWCSANDAAYIDGGAIYANSVTATQIAAGTITLSNLATGVQSSINGAVLDERTIYYSRASAALVPTVPSAWVTDTSGDQGKWTLKRPEYDITKPVLFTAVQKSTNNGFEVTTPVVDQTTTVIDGGHITTGEIDAGVVDVVNLNASNITGGTINGNAVYAKQLSIKDGDNNIIATFDSVIKIGESTKGHSETDYNSYELLDKNQKTYLHIGDDRDEQGLAVRTDSFRGTGGDQGFLLSFHYDSGAVVTVNGTTVSDTDYYIDDTQSGGSMLTFRTPPAVDAYISIQYNTDVGIYRMDFGARRNGSQNGQYSFVIGDKGQYGNEASGYSCVAIGQDCVASNWADMAVGSTCKATGGNSFAANLQTEARSPSSTALGVGAIAYHPGMLAAGYFNSITDDSMEPSEDYEYIFVVGNGSDDLNRSNALALASRGDLHIAGTYFSQSDARLKNEQRDPVPDVSGIRARRFKWNDMRTKDKLDHIGYYAQDVEKAAPYLVHTDGEGYKSLDYIGFLCAKMECMERRIAELEHKLDALTSDGK